MSKEAFAKIAQRIQDLRRELHELDYSYHCLGVSKIPDHEFDAKLRELEVLEKDYPQFYDANSPTSRIGGRPVDGFPEIKHTRRMLSLDKALSAEELHAWLQKIAQPCYLEPKVDGLSVKLHYELGELKLAATRGDGSVGADVTTNARAIPSIPLQLPVPYTGEITGEVYMPWEKFEAYNAKLVADGDEPMANPRNAAVGTFKSKDPKVVAERGLGFIAYGPVNKGMNRAVLQEMGFKIPDSPAVVVAALTEQDLQQILDTVQHLNTFLPYATDGAVVKVMDEKVCEELGEGTKAPNWALAVKFPPPKVKTKLLDIKLSVGRTGRVVPNAVLETVVVSGTKVSASTLHNEDEVIRLGICPGDEVWVQKAGEIIPQVVGLASDLGVDPTEGADRGITRLEEIKFERAWKMPSHYVDNYGRKHEIIREAGFVAHRLKDPKNCEEVVHAQLLHATSKKCLDWDGLGDEHVRTLVVNACSDVLDLMNVPADRTGLEGKVLEKFIAGREVVKKRPLWRVFAALAPEGIGTTHCKQLAALTRNWQALVATPAWRLEELLGEVKGKILHTAFADLSVQFRELEAIGFVLDDDKLAANGAVQTLKGMVFCITGTLTRGRDEMHEIIEKHGGLAKTSCGKATNYLVIGDEPGATKIKAAEKHGVKQINEEQLLQLING